MGNKFSYSKLDTYNQCKYKYKLIYVDGHYVFSGNIATEVGTLIHETEEKIAYCLKEERSIDYISLKNNIILKTAEIEHKYKNDFIEKDKCGRTYADKIYFYITKGIYRLENFMLAHPSFKIIGIEQKFNLAYNNHIFTGAIDRIFFDTATNRYLIQDIKSWKAPAEHAELTTPLQFVIYSMAVADLYKCDFDRIYCQYDLPFCDVIQDAGTSGYMSRGLKKLDKLFTGIETNDFEPNPSQLCHWCNFCPTNPNQPESCKLLCPYYMKWTREHKTFETARKWEGMERHSQILEDYKNDCNLIGHEL